MKRIHLSLLLFYTCFNMACDHPSHEKEIETTFLVTSPVLKDTLVYKDYVCQIHSINHIEIRSQERGYLQKIYIDEGQFVKEGQIMFQIMPLIFQAEKQKAQANVSFAEIEYLTTKSLADSNIVSKNELALAKAKLDKEKAELSLAQAHLMFTEIHAPFSGMMGRFHKQLGSLIDEGELLSSLSDNSKMWVYFNVPEAEYLEYANFANTDSLRKVKLLMANNQLFDHMGIVETIEADFNNETGNIAFRATFPNPKKILRHGETGNIQMPSNIKKALLIPQKATFEILDKKFVFVVDENNVVKSRQITVGLEMPHLYLVTAGLNTNDKILIEGLRKVKNNEKIKTEFMEFQKVMLESNELHAE
ncbi:MAG: efflux RND transporter periplasmic adaptor subunit [Saprospiraceae bacterium]|nr:efflux RND transporter periplasmic adaptor subunit [Saprospiraceae bacterium]MBK7812616.1 efflux RND transporter periplasmic adaptor subunit [Saprospiraceae bacterium]MBK9630807.1 efflux RND transporter periplasmic adaptor subunit [Saprospiraceae bacterium]